MARFLQLVSLAFIKRGGKIPKVTQKQRGGGLILQASFLWVVIIIIIIIIIMLCYYVIAVLKYNFVMEF